MQSAFLRDVCKNTRKKKLERAASSSPSPSPCGVGPLPSHDAETKILFPVLRDDARGGPNPRSWGGERGSSRWLQAAMRNRSTGEPKASGVVLRTPRLRALDLSQRIEAQGGQRGTAKTSRSAGGTSACEQGFWAGTQCPPGSPTCLSLFSPIYHDTLLKKRSARYHLQALERWLSGRRHVPAKDAYPSKGTVGSNPTLSDFFFNKRPA